MCLYKLLKTVQMHQVKAEPQMEEGTWLGISIRTEEVLIGTSRGVVKCRTIKRLPRSERAQPADHDWLYGRLVAGYGASLWPVRGCAVCRLRRAATGCSGPCRWLYLRSGPHDSTRALFVGLAGAIRPTRSCPPLERTAGLKLTSGQLG